MKWQISICENEKYLFALFHMLKLNSQKLIGEKDFERYYIYFNLNEK